MVNVFSEIDKNYIKKFFCDEFDTVERDQDILSKILKKLSEELKKPDYKDKEMDILNGDKLESIMKDMKAEAYAASPIKKKRLNPHNYDYDD